jgi:hypothetical protein
MATASAFVTYSALSLLYSTIIRYRPSLAPQFANRSAEYSLVTDLLLSEYCITNFEFKDIDPYSYTGGRWLNRDSLERTSRHVKFDFSALCERAIRVCPDATRIIKYEKREGGFNRVFLLTMDNGTCVVARIPTSISGPPRLTTNSEVATMTYCKTSPCIRALLRLGIWLAYSLARVSYSTVEDLASDT